MKKFILLCAGLLICSLSFAQNTEGTADDKDRIALTPVVDEESSVPSYARKVLETKLRDIVTRSGLAASSTSPRFVITANLNLLNKELTPTAPPMTAVQLATTLYIGDAVTGQLFATYTYDSVKGVGQSEQRAYMAAVKNLKATSAELDAFVEKGKVKIIEYYNTQIDFIITEANALANQEKYDDALELLASVPSVCKEAYEKAMDKIAVIYKKKIDSESAVYLAQASAVWKANKTAEGAREAIDLLAKVNPMSNVAEQSKSLVSEIEAHNAELKEYARKIEERNFQFAREKEKMNFNLQKHQATMAVEAAKHKARSKRTVINVHRWGWY